MFRLDRREVSIMEDATTRVLVVYLIDDEHPELE